MNDNLKELIKFIKEKHTEVSCKWKENPNYIKVNFANKQVRDIITNNEILDLIFRYREFLNENNILLPLEFEKFNINEDKVNTRVKQKNSVEYKLKNYMSEKHNFR